MESYVPTHKHNQKTFVIYGWSLLSMALNGIGRSCSQLFWALVSFCMKEKHRKIDQNISVFCFVLIVIFLVVFKECHESKTHRALQLQCLVYEKNGYLDQPK